MAKYTAAPNYVVSGGIEFTPFGTYETSDAKEIALLDSLTPTWITRIEEVDKSEESPEVEAAKPAPKPRKTSAK